MLIKPSIKNEMENEAYLESEWKGMFVLFFFPITITIYCCKFFW